MHYRWAIAAGALFVVFGTAPDLSAQGPESAATRRPYRGLFGAPAASDSPHSLVLTGSAYGAYDDNVVEALTNRRISRPWLQQSGAYFGADVGLHYGFAAQGQRASIGGHLGGRASYYHHGERSEVLPSSSADVLFTFALTRSLNFAVRESVAYTSNYNGSSFLLEDQDGHEIVSPDVPDLDLFGLESIRTATTVSLTQRFGRYTSLGAGYHFRSRDVLATEEADSEFRDYRTHAGSLRLGYARPMSRHATLKLGYGIKVSDRRSRTGDPNVMHSIDAGVDYSRALSFSRRTSFSFGTGSGIAVSEQVDQLGGDRRVRARLTGHASLVHEIGRTWTASLTYARGFRTREGFDQLYFTDSVNANIGGHVNRRLSLSAGAAWAESSLEQSGRNGQGGISASAQGTFALTSFAAFFARYIYYHYRFDEDIRLDERFPRQLDRHGVRVGLTTSFPLIR